MTKDQTESAALWFERHMPPMPGARAMYQTAVEALRAVGRLQAEKDALLAQAKDTGWSSPSPPPTLPRCGMESGSLQKSLTTCLTWMSKSTLALPAGNIGLPHLG